MTHIIGHVDPWWNDSFKELDYTYIPIKNSHDEERWIREGYVNVTLNGALYGMPSPMPEYADRFLEIFDAGNNIADIINPVLFTISDAMLGLSKLELQ
jgi:hypothetical protein